MNTANPAGTTLARDDSVAADSLYTSLSFSIVGLLFSVLMYAFFSKWSCCEKTLFEKVKLICKRWRKKLYKLNENKQNDSKHDDNSKDDKQDDSRPLCGSNATINLVTILHLLGKPLLIIVNCIYLSRYGLPSGPGKSLDILGLGNDTTLSQSGRNFAQVVSFICAVYEIVTVVIIPIYIGFFWVVCWKKKLEDGGCRSFLEFIRFGDLEITVLLAPLANVYLFILGGPWYAVIIARLAFYAVTFAAAVIAGVRLICGYACWICCECSCNNEVVEIRDLKHLVLNILVKLGSIAMKLLTCSSSFATYLTIGILQPPPVRFSYFAFTLLRGVTALFSLGFTAAMLRWEVLEEAEQANDKGISKIFRFLKRYEPHSHIAFAFDLLTYLGLIILNIYIAITGL